MSEMVGKLLHGLCVSQRCNKPPTITDLELRPCQITGYETAEGRVSLLVTATQLLQEPDADSGWKGDSI